MVETHIKLDHVFKGFSANSFAVDDVSLSIPKGSFTTLLGPSGCGKTTLLRLIAGLYDPESGDIYLGARRVNSIPAHRRKIAMVFQDYALFPHMSVRDNVGYGLKLAGVRGDETRRSVAEALSLVGLEGFESRMPSQLSGGQQQRVAIARSLVVNPELLLLDEPLSNLDAKLRATIREELLSLQGRLGITTIYVTHDQQEALAMSDWIAVMDRGKVVQWGTPQEVYYHPCTPFVADFIGTVNLLPARVVQMTDGKMTVQLGDSNLELPLNGTAHSTGEEVLLSIRPETLKIVDAECAELEGTVALRGEVSGRTFLGHLARYIVEVEGSVWTVDLHDPGPNDRLAGSVGILVNPGRVHVISAGN